MYKAPRDAGPYFLPITQTTTAQKKPLPETERGVIILFSQQLIGRAFFFYPAPLHWVCSIYCIFVALAQ